MYIEILEAFFKLYSSREIEDITTNDIIDLANCNRSTFYSYFYDKYNLFEQAQQFLLEHTKANSDIYLNIFLKELKNPTILLQLVSKYSYFLKPLLNKNVKFSNEYMEAIKTIFKDKIVFSLGEGPNEVINDSVAASITYLTYRYLNKIMTAEDYIRTIEFLFRDAIRISDFENRSIVFKYEIKPNLEFRNGTKFDLVDD